MIAERDGKLINDNNIKTMKNPLVSKYKYTYREVKLNR